MRYLYQNTWYLIFLLFVFYYTWFFVIRIYLIILLWRANLGTLNHQVKISRDPFILKTIFAHRFENFTCTSKLEAFLSRTWSLFRDCNTTNLGIIFFIQKIKFITFFRCDYFIFTWFKYLSRKIGKNGGFILLAY